MADPELFVVGVPGMGNADLSWHQRRPYGFSRCGYSKVQARVHAYRRPSTASGRLSSQARTTYYRPAPPSLAANRSEYWGAGNNYGNNGNSNSDVSHAGYQRQQRFSRNRRGSRGFRLRERPLSAGCNPSSPPSSRVPTNTAAGGTTTAVEACTRNRAGIVRAGGRDGRAAPPPTPPPPPSPSSPHASQEKHRQQPLAPSDNMRRRRPSTAGSMRSPGAVSEEAGDGYHHQFNHASARGASAEDVDVRAGDAVVMSSRTTGIGCSSGGTQVFEDRRAPRDGAELVVRPPRHLAGDTFACQGHSFPSRVANHDDGDVSHAAGQASEAAGATHSPSHAQSPSLNRSIVYRRSSRDERGRAAEVAGNRRRPASAAPPRSRATGTYDRFQNSTERGGSSGYDTDSGSGRASGVEPTRGRPSARAGGRGMQRPRSASATTGRRAAVPDVGAFTPVATGAGRSFTPAVRPRAQSACTQAAVVPSFVVSEKQVLRFFGHLTEELDWGCRRSAREEEAGELSPPTLKIRQVVLHLYLGDGSLEIFEKRQANSGQQGGLLLKRNLFRKRDGALYGVGDLKVGSDLKLLGRSYRLTGCDGYTRKWYENEGFHQPEDQQAPEEIHQRLRVEDTTGLCNKPQRPNTANSDRPTSAGRSVQGQASLRRAHHQKVNRFFRHDKETLRFKAVWDDPSYGGVRRQYDLLLFLEDETVSLLNPREAHRNSGRDESMVHVRRQRLPKDWKVRPDVYFGGDGGDGGDGFVGELDLAVGRTVHVWGREMKLVGCDPFTQAYYRREHGINMATSLDEEATERSRHKARRVYHPAGGSHWSTEGKAAAVGTDYLTASLGQYEGGAPSGTFPVDRYRGHRIRCKAALRSNMPNDKGREFVVTYDLALDTLMVHELQRRNSGRPGGLFLVKGKHRRPDKNNRYYVPQDLFLGAVVPLVTGHTLVITEMDRSSLALCEENPREFPLMDSQRVLGRVVQRARNMRLALRSELRRRAAGPMRDNVSTFHASSTGGGVCGTDSCGGGIIPPSSIPMTSAAAAANVSSWPAGKVLTNSNGSSGSSPRQNQPRTHPTAATTAEAPPRQGPVTSSRATAAGSARDTTASVKSGHHNGNNFVPTGRRVRSGATWGLVGGWGDSFATPAQAEVGAENAPSNGSGSSNRERRTVVHTTQPGCEYGTYRRGTGRGNPKNESATAPWAAVQAAGVNVYTSNLGQAMIAARAADTGTGVGSGAIKTRRSSEGDNDPYSFEDHAAFRDAMDDLGLLVGLGQQEVLTLVRAFTVKRGKRIHWASMCDRMSQIAATTRTTFEENAPGGARDTMGGVLAVGRTQYSPREPSGDDTTLLRRLRKTGVAWRSVFARVAEDLGKGAACCYLGVASLVQAMRRNGLAIGAGDAAFLARRFAKGGGSQVDYHQLCDKIYPCDFSLPPTSSSPNSADDGCDRGFFPPSSSSRPPCNVRHEPSADLDFCQPPTTTLASHAVPIHDAGAGGGRGRSVEGFSEGLGAGKGRRARAPSCDFDLGGGGGGGGRDGEYGGGDGERTWSLWDRKEHPPEQRRPSYGRDDGDGSAYLRRREGDEGSSQYWDEANAVSS